MQRIDSQIVGIDRGSLLLFSDVEDGGAMWTGTGPRLVRRTIAFSQPFRIPPTVLVSMEMWDADGSSNQRADLSASQIKSDRFDVVFKTWGDSRVARVRAGWLAIGAVGHPDDWQL